MSLLVLSNITSSLSPSLSLSSSTLAIPPNPSYRLTCKSISLKSKQFNGLVQIHTPFRGNGCVIVKASADIDGTSSSDAPEAPPSSGSEAEVKKVEDLPLESKLQLKLDQKIKMKLAKKIRLRRKRLVRKRQLRKKGRWPPSKMKKGKNV